MLALFGGPAYQQFLPGRIDHHNVQIALTLLVVAATVWSDRKVRCASVAGGLTALCLAIGFGALPYLAVCGAAIALRFLFDPQGGAALKSYSLALTAAVIIAFLVTVDPGQWITAHCDALAINVTVAICAGAVVLAAAGQASPQSFRMRTGYLILAAAFAFGLTLLIEPRCLNGPYAMVDPRIWSIWLAEVRENQPVSRLATINPLTLSAILVFPLAAVAATAWLAVRTDLRCTFPFLAAAATFLSACLATYAAIRGFSYTTWLALPMMAAAIAVLPSRFLLWRKAVLAILVSPLALSIAIVAALGAVGFEDTQSSAGAESARCLRSDVYRQLAALPPGLVVADITYGPFILALTPHSVMSAPYHRLSEGIVAAHEILSAPPDQAGAVAHRVEAAYIALCGGRPPYGLSDDALNRSLWSHLQAGAVPDWLDPVSATIGQSFTVFRVLP